MLWYKAWLETRGRFLISLGGIAAVCALAVYDNNRRAAPFAKPSYYYWMLHNTHGWLMLGWVPAVTLLMMGGLLREEAVESSAFTLALPVDRRRLMGVRIGMGLAQAMALVVVPWSAMFLVSIATGPAHSIRQAGFHAVLLAGGGMIFFALAVLISSIVKGEYTAPVVSLAVAIGMFWFAFSPGRLQFYNPLVFAMGDEYYDHVTSLLAGPIPWMHVAGNILAAGFLLAVSVRIIERRDF